MSNYWFNWLQLYVIAAGIHSRKREIYYGNTILEIQLLHPLLLMSTYSWYLILPVHLTGRENAHIKEIWTYTWSFIHLSSMFPGWFVSVPVLEAYVCLELTWISIERRVTQEWMCRNLLGWTSREMYSHHLSWLVAEFLLVAGMIMCTVLLLKFKVYWNHRS